MVKKERRALGRGLGSLIPSGDEIVSRETIRSEDARDVFFPKNGLDSGERSSASIAADLMKPVKRRKPSSRGAKKSGSTAAREKTPSTASDSKATSSVAGEDVASSAARQKATSKRAEKEIVSRETISNDASSAQPDLVPVPGAMFAEINLERIVPNLQQPRQVFDEDELNELSESIKEIGVLQPIVVRPIDRTDERYEVSIAQHIDADRDEQIFELIMGERRWRASKLAGEETIPAIIRESDDVHQLRDALLENLHRSQLNAIEEASAYQQLMRDFQCTQEELSTRIARSRSHIANTVRLLKLPGSVQRKLAANVISSGHARALLSLTSAADMEQLAERIVAEGLSVRSTEEIVALGMASGAPNLKRSKRRAAAAPSEDANVIIESLTELLDTRVSVVEGKRKGKIIVEYAGTDDLARITQIISGFKAGEE